MTVTNKICKLCRKRTPIENFPSRHHKICTLCVERRRENTLRYLGEIQEATGEPRRPGLTSTRDGLRKYARERARARAPERKAPLYPAETKLCRQCQLTKPRSEFRSWRHYLCAKCDGAEVQPSTFRKVK